MLLLQIGRESRRVALLLHMLSRSRKSGLEIRLSRISIVWDIAWRRKVRLEMLLLRLLRLSIEGLARVVCILLLLLLLLLANHG